MLLIATSVFPGCHRNGVWPFTTILHIPFLSFLPFFFSSSFLPLSFLPWKECIPGWTGCYSSDQLLISSLKLKNFFFFFFNLKKYSHHHTNKPSRRQDTALVPTACRQGEEQRATKPTCISRLGLSTPLPISDEMLGSVTA